MFALRIRFGAMIGADVFISCGDEVGRYRDIGKDVLRRLEHMFQSELDVPLTIGNWDFRLDAPRVVPAGALATRSLAMVEKTNALVAIFGAALPRITCKEIRHAFDLRQRGEPVEVWVFLDRHRKTENHSQFLNRIKRTFHEQVVFAQYGNELEFQALLFTTLAPYFIKRTLTAPDPLGESL